jgi:hypothetical protein
MSDDFKGWHRSEIGKIDLGEHIPDIERLLRGETITLTDMAGFIGDIIETNPIPDFVEMKPGVIFTVSDPSKYKPPVKKPVKFMTVEQGIKLLDILEYLWQLADTGLSGAKSNLDFYNKVYRLREELV